MESQLLLPQLIKLLSKYYAYLQTIYIITNYTNTNKNSGMNDIMIFSSQQFVNQFKLNHKKLTNCKLIFIFDHQQKMLQNLISKLQHLLHFKVVMIEKHCGNDPSLTPTSYSNTRNPHLSVSKTHQIPHSQPQTPDLPLSEIHQIPHSQPQTFDLSLSEIHQIPHLQPPTPDSP